MMHRELGEVIAYAIAAYKKSEPVEAIFTVNPTDANGYMAAFIVKAIEHYNFNNPRENDGANPERK